MLPGGGVLSRVQKRFVKKDVIGLPVGDSMMQVIFLL